MSDELAEFLIRARGAGVATARVLELDGNAPSWGLPALRGRLIELSARGATATLTCAVELVIEAQKADEPVAWIMGPAGSFYPPDVAECGVDLAALVVVRVPELEIAARAAERLVRSGAFGLVVIDLADGRQHPIELPIAHQGRLVTLAQAHDAAIVCLTEKSAEAGSLGSLISLRAEALRNRQPDGFEVGLRVLKDKRRGPGMMIKRKARGPAGL